MSTSYAMGVRQALHMNYLPQSSLQPYEQYPHFIGEEIESLRGSMIYLSKPP